MGQTGEVYGVRARVASGSGGTRLLVTRIQGGAASYFGQGPAGPLVGHVDLFLFAFSDSK